MNKECYEILDEICFRTPSLPFQAAKKFYETNLCVKEVQKLLENEFIYEAIYLASPSLIYQLETIHHEKTDSKKIDRALLAFSKYFLRMSTRPTPFGLFSGVFIGKFCEKTEVNIDTINIGRRTRLGFDALFLIYENLLAKKDVRNKLNFHLNTSLYRIGLQYRYIKSHSFDSKKKYVLQELVFSETLETTLNYFSKPSSINAYINFMVQDGYLKEDCTTYIDDLIKRQVLIADLHPYSVGNPYLQYLVDTLAKIEANLKETILLSQFRDKLKEFDTNAQKVIHKFIMPNLVKTGEKKRFVYVLPKFVIGDNEKLMIELKELNGERKIQLLQ